MDFVHLHVHSHYSPDGVASVRDLVRYAERQGMRALALTDQDTLAGIAEFCALCREAAIRPVIGCDMTIVPLAMSDMSADRPYRIVLLAETEAGYRNLVKLVNLSHGRPRRSQPCIDMEMLEKHSSGLIAMTGGSSTELYNLLLGNRIEETENYIRKLARVFGRENLILQLEDVEQGRQKQINDRIFALSDFLGVRCVATNYVCYLRPEDSVARDFLVRGRFPSFLQFQAARETAHSQHLAGGTQMRDRFLKYPRALYATEEVADRCSFQLNYQKRRFPIHDFVRGFDADSFLWDLTFREARARFVELSPDLKNRLNEEFDYIKSHGLSNNVLLLWNIAQFVRKNKISVGVGRGEMITSLVAYILGITRINPLDYKLLFQGFATEKNAEPALTVEMPVRHIEALHAYMRETFGADFCSAVGKHTWWNRGALGREVRSWLYAKPSRTEHEEVPYSKDLNVDSPLEAFFPGKSDGVALPSAEFENFLLSRLLPRPKDFVLDENQFAISSENLNHLTPRVPTDDQLVTQMDGRALDQFHIPRLTIITDPVLNILDSGATWVRKEENASFDPDRIPMDDEATYDLLCRGLTNGIEPFSSITLKSLLRAHRPRNFMSLLKIKGLERSPNSAGGSSDVTEHVAECLLTYRCAYIKAHYPMSFMASLLTHSFRNRRKFTVILREAKQMGLKILPPDINLSVYEFSQVHKAIRTGLMVVSGMGPRVYQELHETRRGGDYADMMDLVRRTDSRLINSRILSNLVKVGALDSFGMRRSQMLHIIDHDVEIARRNATSPELFDQQDDRPITQVAVDPPDISELPLQEIIRFEIAAAGYCIGYDQLLLYKDLVEKCRALAPADLVPRMVGKEVHVAGFLDHVEVDSPLVEEKEHILLDLEGHVVTMPMKIGSLYDQALHASAPVLIGGTIHRRKDEVYVKGLTAFTLRMVQEMSQHVRALELDLSGEDGRTVRLIKSLVSYYRGQGTEIKLHNVPQGAVAKWFGRGIERTPVFFSPPFYYALKKILPEEHISIIASDAMDPSLLHALSPLRYEQAEPVKRMAHPEADNADIVDVY